MAALVAYEFGTLLVWAAVALWIVLWFVAVFEILFRRADLTVGSKVLWILVVLLLPFIGLFVYYGFSGRGRPA